MTERKTVEEARQYHAKEFVDLGGNSDAPEKLRFAPGSHTTDPDRRSLSDADLEAARRQGEAQA